jgi:general secretion pathway protein N
MRSLRIAVLVVVALAALIGVAAWTCPADLGYRVAGDALAPIRLRDLTGTIWNGHAAHTDLLGTDLGAMDWELQPLPLLRGVMAARVTLAGAQISGHASVERSGVLTDLHDAALHLPARLAAPVLAIPALDLLGTIQIDIGRARLRGLFPEAAAGTARWRDAAVAGAAQAPLGDLQATFATTADGAIAGSVHDLGGPLEVAGTFRAGLGQYEAQARLIPRGDNPQLNEALQYVGQPQADGSRSLQIRGRALDLLGNAGGP